MADTIKKSIFIKRLAKRANIDELTAAKWTDTVLDTIYAVFREDKGVSFQGFGKFYLDRRGDTCAFKFNPSQKLRALLGLVFNLQGKTLTIKSKKN